MTASGFGHSDGGWASQPTGEAHAPAIYRFGVARRNRDLEPVY